MGLCLSACSSRLLILVYIPAECSLTTSFWRNIFKIILLKTFQILLIRYFKLEKRDCKVGSWKPFNIFSSSVILWLLSLLDVGNTSFSLSLSSALFSHFSMSSFDVALDLIRQLISFSWRRWTLSLHVFGNIFYD